MSIRELYDKQNKLQSLYFVLDTNPALCECEALANGDGSMFTLQSYGEYSGAWRDCGSFETMKEAQFAFGMRLHGSRANPPLLRVVHNGAVVMGWDGRRHLKV
jgi:hypothetical protein